MGKVALSLTANLTASRRCATECNEHRSTVLSIDKENNVSKEEQNKWKSQKERMRASSGRNKGTSLYPHMQWFEPLGHVVVTV